MIVKSTKHIIAQTICLDGQIGRSPYSWRFLTNEQNKHIADWDQEQTTSQLIVEATSWTRPHN